VALAISLFVRSLSRHHMDGWDRRSRNGTANFGCSAPTPARWNRRRAATVRMLDHSD
jgi:hypothetical protein